MAIKRGHGHVEKFVKANVQIITASICLSTCTYSLSFVFHVCWTFANMRLARPARLAVSMTAFSFPLLLLSFHIVELKANFVAFLSPLC